MKLFAVKNCFYRYKYSILTDSLILYLVKELGCLYNTVEKLRRWLFPIGGGAYGVKPLKPINPNERSSLNARCGRFTIMLAFGTFTVALIALIVELIKSQQKNNRLSSGQLAIIKYR